MHQHGRKIRKPRVTLLHDGSMCMCLCMRTNERVFEELSWCWVWVLVWIGIGLTFIDLIQTLFTSSYSSVYFPNKARNGTLDFDICIESLEKLILENFHAFNLVPHNLPAARAIFPTFDIRLLHLVVYTFWIIWTFFATVRSIVLRISLKKK